MLIRYGSNPIMNGTIPYGGFVTSFMSIPKNATGWLDNHNPVSVLASGNDDFLLENGTDLLITESGDSPIEDDNVVIPKAPAAWS